MSWGETWTRLIIWIFLKNSSAIEYNLCGSFKKQGENIAGPLTEKRVLSGSLSFVQFYNMQLLIFQGKLRGNFCQKIILRMNTGG